MLTIFKREFKSYFSSPFGYAFIAILWILFGLFFTLLYAGGSSQTNSIFNNYYVNISLMVAFIPVLTMRLMSEDKRLKTDQLLRTAPIKSVDIVLGKFLAAFAIFAIGISITLVYQIFLACFVSVDWMVYLGCLVGVLLFGAALIAIGLFMSSLTESMVVAFVCSAAVSLVLVMLDFLTYLINGGLISKIISWISFSGRYSAFASGIFDYSNAVFFLSFAAVFLFLAVRVTETKKWA